MENLDSQIKTAHQNNFADISVLSADSQIHNIANQQNRINADYGADCLTKQLNEKEYFCAGINNLVKKSDIVFHRVK